MIYGPGLGPTNPAIPEGLLLATNSTPVNPISITIGTTVVTPDFVGLLAGYAGLYQINVTIPNGATGDVPIFATVKGVSSTNTTACCFLSVH